MVVVLTQTADSHADLVIECLRQRGTHCVRINTADYPEHITLTSAIDNRTCRLTLTSGERIDLEEVCAVWWRHPEPPRPAARGDAEYVRFGQRESWWALGSLWYLLEQRFWVNPYPAFSAARHKPFQLHAARAVGLEVPRTLVTNDPDSVADFFERCSGRMIYKGCETTRRIDGAGRRSALFTAAVERADLARVLESVALAPCIFQEYVPKRSEIRVTIVGDRLFAAEIQPLDGAAMACDWRVDSRRVRCVPFRLDPGTEEDLMTLMHRLGLVFGCVDMVRRPDDRLVFLEVNPVGQWYWVEQATGLPILESMVDLLLGRHGGVA